MAVTEIVEQFNELMMKIGKQIQDPTFKGRVQALQDHLTEDGEDPDRQDHLVRMGRNGEMTGVLAPEWYEHE